MFKDWKAYLTVAVLIILSIVFICGCDELNKANEAKVNTTVLQNDVKYIPIRNTQNTIEIDASDCIKALQAQNIDPSKKYSYAVSLKDLNINPSPSYTYSSGNGPRIANSSRDDQKWVFSNIKELAAYNLEITYFKDNKPLCYNEKTFYIKDNCLYDYQPAEEYVLLVGLVPIVSHIPAESKAMLKFLPEICDEVNKVPVEYRNACLKIDGRELAQIFKNHDFTSDEKHGYLVSLTDRKTGQKIPYKTDGDIWNFSDLKNNRIYVMRIKYFNNKDRLASFIRIFETKDGDIREVK